MSNPSATSSTLEPVVTISQDRDIVTAIKRFDVPSDQQAEAVQKAADHIAQEWKGDSKFVGAILLRGRDQGGVSCYAQWKSPTDGEEPSAPVASRSLAVALPTFKLLDSRTYTVEFTDQAESMTPPTQVSMQTPYAHFGIFSVTRENQDRLLDLARKYAPKSLTTPGLLAIDFHRSIDGLQVINLGVWTTFDDFNFLIQRPGFRDDNLYWEGVADFQGVFFDVVAVEVGHSRQPLTR
ncbi:antibiotic biosynthesis monooxygenase [Nostoc sp.]|uniref:antibiotic biosynthesis monooxygenase n=1 Tax=Nostoc sp. TaxID=1180 RepID=UPI002FF8B3BC